MLRMRRSGAESQGTGVVGEKEKACTWRLLFLCPLTKKLPVDLRNRLGVGCQVGECHRRGDCGSFCMRSYLRFSLEVSEGDMMF